MENNTTELLHTGGIWEVEEIVEDCDIDIRNHHGVMIATVLGATNFPCLPPEHSGNFQAEVEANARLICAAPDLLAACQAFVEAWERSLQLEKTDVALRLAKQAIEKATGGAP